jgi:hypothetical protein
MYRGGTGPARAGSPVTGVDGRSRTPLSFS